MSRPDVIFWLSLALMVAVWGGLGVSRARAHRPNERRMIVLYPYGGMEAHDVCECGAVRRVGARVWYPLFHRRRVAVKPYRF